MEVGIVVRLISRTKKRGGKISEDKSMKIKMRRR